MGTNQESRRARRSADEWRQVLSRFVGSGLAVEAFCNREGISDTSFRQPDLGVMTFARLSPKILRSS
jgi:hypothetical protein